MPRRVPNLHEVLDDLCERYLGRTLDVEIEWGDPEPHTGIPSYACVGLDDDDELVITIDESLKLPWVPLYFVRDVVWHEACHVVLYERTGDFGAEHDSTFRVLESLHRDRQRSAAWESANAYRFDRASDRRRRQVPQRSAR